MTYDYNALQFI